MNEQPATIESAMRPFIVAIASEVVRHLRATEQPSQAPATLLVDVKEAARLLAISENQFRGLVAAGEIVGVDIRGRGKGERSHRRFSIEELRRWIASREAKATNNLTPRMAG